MGINTPGSAKTVKKESKIINALPFAQIKKNTCLRNVRSHCERNIKRNWSRDGRELKAREVARGGGDSRTAFAVTFHGRERI